MSQQIAVVIDNGSGLTKAGFSNEDNPKCVFPTFVGKTKSNIPNKPILTFYGNEANSRRGSLRLEYPIQNGYVQNWDVMRYIWKYLFEDELRLDSTKDHPVLLTEPPLNPKKNREKMTQIMFEKFKVPAMYIANPCVLSLYCSGRTTGVVLDSGECVSNVVPVYEGFAFPQAIQRFNIAGRHLNEYLGRIITGRGYYYDRTTAEQEIIREIKENICYVASDIYKEKIVEETHILPDGTGVTLGSERFYCPEVLFRPDLIGKESPGIHDFLNKSINKTDVDIRKILYKNIVLAGGSTLFPGMANRIKDELLHLAPQNTDVKVIAHPQRNYSVWIGGAILASLSTFQDAWISKREYEEIGVNIVHTKCF